MSDYTPAKVETLKLSHSCKLEITHSNFGTECELIYTEHSPDHWYGDSETTIDIDKETASAIIAFLSKFVEEK